MDPDLSEDIRATIRAAFARYDSRDHGPGAWDALSQQVGITGLFVPEHLGGAGLGLREIALVAGELGRAAARTPFLSTVVLATNLVLATTDGAYRSELLSRLLEGKTVIAVAVAEPDGKWQTTDSSVTARESASGWLLNGTKYSVIDGSAADILFVLAGTRTGVTWFVVEAGSAGVERSVADAFDSTRDLATISLTDVAATPLIGPDRAADVARDTLLRGLLAVAADQVGVAERALELAVEHAKSRTQFGKPIGSFQAIKHRCADSLLELELARATVDSAAATDTDDSQVELAYLYASRAAITAAEASIQIHGGIGFTWEHDAHLFLRRARLGAVLFGPLGEHREAIARSAGLPLLMPVTNP
ncbi:acyl-CoA dehydrogenase family protein [Nocardia sp. NPDC052278]|uniref:acyl-CoA dehydrogenase family protein n=1 Tax=unclassified Nocardia TaxID=2637762 RepID=UPI0036C1A992